MIRQKPGIRDCRQKQPGCDWREYLIDNMPFDLVGDIDREAVNALNNWWGSSQGLGKSCPGLKGKSRSNRS